MIIDPADLRFNVYTSGYGTRPLVRITHLLTGVTVENDSTPSQILNRERALDQLRQIIATF